MTKDAPAFDFYPERFWFAVEGWTEPEICRYWRLLGQQWMRDGLPADEKELRGLARGALSERLLGKFPVAADGRRRNPFLERLRIDQRERITATAFRQSITAWKRWHKNEPLPPYLASIEAFKRHTHGNATASPTAMPRLSPPPTTHHPPQINTITLSRPSLPDALSAAGNIGISAKEAEEWWNTREATDWMKGTAGNGTLAVGQNWQADMKTFTNNKRERHANNRTGHRTDPANKPGRYA